MCNRFFITLIYLWICHAVAEAGMIDQRDGTVTDLTTGLVWQKGEAGAMTWAEAVVYCQRLVLAGESTWRLPSSPELHSLVDYSRSNPAIDTDVFPGALPTGYWSSTPYSLHSDIAWMVDFADGTITYGIKSARHYVRAVSGGK